MQEYTARVLSKKYLTRLVMEFELQLISPDSIDFRAGQNMEFKIGETWLPYAIASSPAEQNSQLSFCVELLSNFAAATYFKNLEPGASVSMRGPSGDLFVESATTPLFFLANGIGVVPFRSIIIDLLAHGFSLPCKLVFGVRTEEDVFYYDKFSNLASIYSNFRFTPVILRPVSHWPAEVGSPVTYLDAYYMQFKQYTFYICADAQTAQSAKNILLKNSHPESNIKLEILK